MFIIIKSTRDTREPYAGVACREAGVPPGKVYQDFEEAKADMQKLTSVNPVGFRILDLTLPEYPTAQAIQDYQDSLKPAEPVKSQETLETEVKQLRVFTTVLLEIAAELVDEFTYHLDTDSPKSSGIHCRYCAGYFLPDDLTIPEQRHDVKCPVRRLAEVTKNYA